VPNGVHRSLNRANNRANAAAGLTSNENAIIYSCGASQRMIASEPASTSPAAPVPVYSRKGRRWAAVAGSGLLVALLLLLTVRTPSLAQLPARAATGVLPPLPVSAAGAPADLTGSIDLLPLVEREFPDLASRRAADDFAGATLLAPQGAAQMFLDAWDSLVVPAGARPAVLQLAGRMVGDDTYVGLPENDPPDFRSVLNTAFAALVAQPQNAGRLNNAAVALFFLGVANEYGRPVSQLRGLAVARSGRVEDAALRLLAEVERRFPDDRAARLNYAYLRSIVPTGGNAIEFAIAPAARQLARDPADRTARLLLASLQVRQNGSDDGIAEASATLAPLAGDAATAALAHAALGDAYLIGGRMHQAEAPFRARELAKRALAEYDRTIELSSDAGGYAGRASALALLGAFPEAIAAQQRALAAGAGWNPPLRTLRLESTVDPSGLSTDLVDGDSGYLGLSAGSDRAHAGVWREPQGGGYIVAFDLIPRVDDPVFGGTEQRRRVLPAPDVAAMLAVAASTVSGDIDGAAADAGSWEQTILRGPGTAGNPHWEPFRVDLVRGVALAPALVAGRIAPAGVDQTPLMQYAQTVLRRAGRFAEAAAFCRRMAGAPAGFVDRPAALQCEGEAAFHAGQTADAARALQEAYQLRLDRPADEVPATIETPMPVLALRAAAAAQAAGDLNRARALFATHTTSKEYLSEALVQAISLDKIADLDLDAGNLTAAAGRYDVAIDRLVGGSANVDGPSPDDPQALLVYEHAINNRGITRLRQAQRDRAKPPACDRGARERCKQAGDDFAAAAAIDPSNPVYLLNAGWAQRLLGDATAARASLAAAAALDPTLFPALNDLGVLAARSGDLNAARHAFQAALAERPDYDLALWNMGILELQRGVRGVLSGQAWLARALIANPSWRRDAIGYKTDERVYRTTFGTSEQQTRGWAFGRTYSVATAAIASITFLAALAVAFLSFTSDKVREKVKAILAKRGGSLAHKQAVKIAREHRPAWEERLTPSAFDTGADLLLALPEETSVRDKLAKLGSASIARASGRLRPVIATRAPAPLRSLPWAAWEPWLLTVPALVLVTAWPAWRQNPLTGAAGALLGIVAAFLALIMHELGHAVAARWKRAQVHVRSWGTGITLNLILLPVKVSSGPFFGHMVDEEHPHRWLVQVSGPVANVLGAALLYGLFRLEPLPALRLGAQVQLAAAAYALAPIEPLDGKVLAQLHPRLLAVLSLAIAFVAVLFVRGVL